MREFAKWVAISVACALGATIARRLIVQAYKRSVEEQYSVTPAPGRQDL